MQGVTAIALFGIFFIPPISTEVLLIQNYNNTTEIYFCPNEPIWDNCLSKRIEEYSSKIITCHLNCKIETWMKTVFCTENNEKIKCASNSDSFEYDMQLDLATLSIDSSCLHIKEHPKYYKINDSLEIAKNFQIYDKPIEINCEIVCEDEFIKSTLANRGAIADKEVVQKMEFWLFCVLLLFGFSAISVVNSMGDTICFELLGDDVEQFGKQRMWDAIGSGVVSLLVGVIIDKTSGTSVFKSYTVLYFLCLVTISLDMVCCIKLQSSQNEKSKNILSDVGKLFKSPSISTFFCWCCFSGFFEAIILNFLFWYLEELTDEIGQKECVENYVKTLEGLDIFVQTCIGEILFFFFSGYIFKKIGHINCMHLVLAAFAIRMFYYSLMTNPWWVLPVEVLNGITYGLFSATMSSYANIIALPGTEATLQGLVGILYEGVGLSLGNFGAGTLLSVIGGKNTFIVFGIVAVIALLSHVIIHILLRTFNKDKNKVSDEIPVG
ncbi:major facilitator superfamily domain-containing protein 6-like [Condylostylus longicornis]|uniref:major facilitator superfamily domain-containing protein 6-like n=1 Tax=Condylostylus longicornis TaxID=2530218 RepID=UPI00244E1856|nr:major facilitator superfamily domain-containing protein 6-like [Condylostylus longicornis]